ncbi:hypothetical protein [Chryseobacterium sp.]|uniref:hypothetical protein n=1 Tax=Chryseobacterium sp. TaxID=1871047 RepID=UPI0035C74386
MEFFLSIPLEKFRSTNAVWNELMLNDPWSVGYVTTLIELVPFEKKEDWENYYYNSGASRDELIDKLNANEKSVLNNESLVRTNKTQVDNLDWNLKNLNTQYGRTINQLRHKSEILFESVKNNGLNLTLNDCFECVRFRVICETWNGVIVRERNTIKKLQTLFPNLNFKKVSGEMDHTFAVDYEVLKDGVLISAIQIKPPSYFWNAPYIRNARNANKYKNEKYQKQFNVTVFDVISDSTGNIRNQEILKELQDL